MDTGLLIAGIAVGLTAVSIISNAIQFRSKAAVDTVTILKGAVDTLRSEVADLKAKLDQCHADCEKLREQVLAEGGERVRQQLSEATARHAALATAYEAMRRELDTAMATLAQLRGDRDERDG